VTEELAAVGVTVTASAKHRRCLNAQPVRWRIERSIDWLKNFRRFRSDFDRTVNAIKAFFELAGVSLSLRRPCRTPVV
jgi:hypothetical protein